MEAEWSDVERVRYKRRESVFMREGLEASEAARFARLMLLRDRDGFDTRRSCFECRHLRDNARCKPGYLPLRFVLQRCPGFELKGAK